MKINPILMDFPLPIETPRIILRPPKVGEGKMLNEAILESFNKLHKSMHWTKHKPTLDESEEVVRQAAANWILKKNEEPYLMLFIIEKNSNQLIGASGYHHVHWDVPSVETGYWVRDKCEGNGYITETVNALTRYAFEQMGVKRMTITCDYDNIRSKKIPEKLGYTLESTMKANRLKPVTGEISDTLVYVRNDILNLPQLEVTWDKRFKTSF